MDRNDYRKGSPLVYCPECGREFTETAWRMHRHNPQQLPCSLRNCAKPAVGYLTSFDAWKTSFVKEAVFCGEHLLKKYQADWGIVIVDGARCQQCNGNGKNQERYASYGDSQHRWLRCPLCRGTGYSAAPRPARTVPAIQPSRPIQPGQVARHLQRGPAPPPPRIGPTLEELDSEIKQNLSRAPLPPKPAAPSRRTPYGAQPTQRPQPQPAPAPPPTPPRPQPVPPDAPPPWYADSHPGRASAFRASKSTGRRGNWVVRLFWIAAGTIVFSTILWLASGQSLDPSVISSKAGALVDGTQQRLAGESGECNLDAAVRHLASLETPEREREFARALIENDRAYLERMNQRTDEAFACVAHHQRKNASQPLTVLVPTWAPAPTVRPVPTATPDISPVTAPTIATTRVNPDRNLLSVTGWPDTLVAHRGGTEIVVQTELDQVLIIYTSGARVGQIVTPTESGNLLIENDSYTCPYPGGSGSALAYDGSAVTLVGCSPGKATFAFQDIQGEGRLLAEYEVIVVENE